MANYRWQICSYYSTSSSAMAERCTSSVILRGWVTVRLNFRFIHLFIKPPDIHVGGFIFYRGFFFLFSFFFLLFRQLLSVLAERNWTKTGHMLGSECNLKMHVQNLGYPLPLQIGGPITTFFRWLRNIIASLTAYIFVRKRDIHKRASALQTTRGLLHQLKTTWTLAHKLLQIGSEFSPTLSTLHKLCIPLHCHASQTEISKRILTKLCQTLDGRSR